MPIWHDRRVGKGTNQHGNGFALSTYVLLLLLRLTTYSHPTLGFATAHAHSTSSVASARTHRALSVPPTPSLGCAHRSAAGVLAIARRHRCRYTTDTLALVRRRTHGAALPNRSTTLSFPSLFSGSVLPTPGHVLGPADKPPCVGGLYHNRFGRLGFGYSGP